MHSQQSRVYNDMAFLVGTLEHLFELSKWVCVVVGVWRSAWWCTS